MFSHTMPGANDIDASKRFYDAAGLGAKPGRVDDKGRVIYMNNGILLLLTRPINGAPATHANGATTSFAASSPSRWMPGMRQGLRMVA